MKNYADKTETKLVYTSTTCDLCGATSADDWRDAERYDHEIEVEHHASRGDGHGGGNGRTIKVDLCPACFTGKLLAFLRAQGMRVGYEEWDF